jgi:hypothetical protein
MLDQLAYGALPVTQQVEDRAACGLGYELECGHGTHITHQLYA